MNTVTSSKQRGRPRAFDQDEALNKAMEVFWVRGYEGASIADITDALNINRPSLYAAFGNKEQLFRKVLAQYLAGPVAYVRESLDEPSSRKVVEKFLSRSAELLTNKNNPRGCMIVQGALSCGQGSEMIQQELIAYRKGYENALHLRFKKAQADREFSADIDPAVLAKYIATIHQGMSVQATSGASKNDLLKVVKTVLATWPAE